MKKVLWFSFLFILCSASMGYASKNVVLEATVRFDGTAFIIENKDNFDYLRVRISLNARGLRSGYEYKFDSFASGKTIRIPAREFTLRDGTRFNLMTTKPQSIFIYCEIPNSKNRGSALYEFN